jgi:2-dehydro-3-deoxyphosphogluconate aldolase / (4S)-4-hydroxy-2-oxoglutarate aldolase
MKHSAIIDVIRQQGLLPLYFHPDKVISANILRALYRAGVRVVEYTNRGKEAMNNFIHLKDISRRELPGMLLGAGTIKTGDHAKEFIDARADFIISPGWSKEVSKIAANEKIFWVPGCMTPTEIMKAEEAGATLIKLFPGSLLQPSFVAAIKELFPGVLFIPTGGVKLEEENLRSWFKSGVCAVGAGSTLIDRKSVEQGDFSTLESAARNALDLIADVKRETSQ